MGQAINSSVKIPWQGRIISVQARIRLMRSFDERSHSYLGYVLDIDGTCGETSGEFLIAVGPGAHEKYHFQAGMMASGVSVPVDDPQMETAGYYKVSQIKIEKSSEKISENVPPYLGVPPALEVYRERGHRRLDARTYAAKCSSCIWGCRMPVVLIVDHWNPSVVKHRFETFCYGPKNCPFYKAGETRKAPGRRGMVWEEEDWVDEDATSHRNVDE